MSIKKNTTSYSFRNIIIWFFIILLIIVFVLSFMMQEIVDNSKSKGIVGSIDRHSIVARSNSDFYHYYEVFMNRYGQNSKMERYAQIQAFDSVVNDYVLKKWAFKNNLYIFDKELYDGLKLQLSASNITLEEYQKNYSVSIRQQIEERVKNFLYTEKIKNTLFSIIPLTEEEERFHNRLTTVYKKVRIVYWNFSDYYEKIIKEDTLKSYYEKESKKYEKYENFEKAKNFVKIDYINDNSLNLQKTIEEQINNEIESSQGLTLKDLIKTGGKMYDSKQFNVDASGIELKGSDAPVINGQEKVLDLMQLRLNEKSHLIKLQDGLFIAEVIDQSINDVSLENTSMDLTMKMDEKKDQWFNVFNNFLKSKYDIKRNF